MKTAIFYLLQQNIIKKRLNIIEKLTCHLTMMRYRAGKTILIFCESNDQAVKLDNALWIYDINAFIPHNLSNSKFSKHAPVELCWPGYYQKTVKDIVINLLPIYTDFIASFNEVIDFVPMELSLKKLARVRYVTYRKIGFKLTTNIYDNIE